MDIAVILRQLSAARGALALAHSSALTCLGALDGLSLSLDWIKRTKSLDCGGAKNRFFVATACLSDGRCVSSPARTSCFTSHPASAPESDGPAGPLGWHGTTNCGRSGGREGTFAAPLVQTLCLVGTSCPEECIIRDHMYTPSWPTDKEIAYLWKCGLQRDLHFSSEPTDRDTGQVCAPLTGHWLFGTSNGFAS